MVAKVEKVHAMLTCWLKRSLDQRDGQQVRPARRVKETAVRRLNQML